MEVKAAFISDVEIEKIHTASIYVLENVGVQFNHQGALNIFKAHGASIEGNKVFISRGLLAQALQSIPQSFTLHGHNPQFDVVIGSNRQVFAPTHGPINIRDGEIRRPALSSDFINFMKLVESSDVLQLANPNILCCHDVNSDNRAIYQLAMCLKYSSKPLIGITSGLQDSKACIELVKKYTGISGRNILLGVVNPVTPLQYDSTMVEAITVYAENSQPLLISSCSMPGATSPATIASTLVVNNAEVLAGIVLSQLIQPGLGVIYGSASVSCDMRYVTPAIGSPETALITYAAAGLSRYYKLPCRSGGALTDSKQLDVQAGVESLQTIMPAVMTGIDFVLHACGVLESFLTIDYDKFIVDEEIIRMTHRLVQGFEISERTISLDIIEAKGPGANYLSEGHTFENFKREFFYPRIFSRENYLQYWEGQQEQTINSRARLIIQERLAATTEPDKTSEQVKILAEYLL